MIEENLRFCDAGAVRLAYESFGDDSAPVMLLVAGLGAQLVSWDDDFCVLLAERGWRVIRYDNRDVGLSTHLTEMGRPDLVAIISGRFDSVPYHLSDMAADGVGLLDHLDVEEAVVVGVSLGGMIAQTMAIEHPGRVAGLVSVMSTPGPDVAPPTPEAAALLTPAPITSATDAADQAVASARITGSPGYPLDEARIRRRATLSYERARDAAGVGRQLAAILGSPDRTEALRLLAVPTLVIHGTDDPMIGVAGALATANAIPRARLELIDGMGHDVPAALFGRLVDILDRHGRSATRPRRSSSNAVRGSTSGCRPL